MRRAGAVRMKRSERRPAAPVDTHYTSASVKPFHYKLDYQHDNLNETSNGKMKNDFWFNEHWSSMI